MRDQILNSIIELKNKETNDKIEIKSKELVFESSKYSSTGENIWHVIINGIKLKKTSEYSISYKCKHCETINIIGTTQFLRKVRNDNDFCGACRITKLNSDELKEIRKNNILLNTIKIPKEKVELSYEEKHNMSVEEFNNLDDGFRNAYFLNHLTEEDYLRIKPKIKSFCNGTLNDFNDYEFWSVYKVNNQMRYSSVIYDKKRKVIFKANQPILKCDNCTKEWRAKSLEGIKNDHKILCNECKLCNKTFKIRPYKNINNEPIIYQSKLEKKFIDWCESLNIVLKNGPNIDYVFNDKSHKYRVDFMINDLLIEIKDMHIWHKNQVESGLWQCKVDATNNYIKSNNLKKYYFITPNNWNQMLKEIENTITNKKLNKI